VIPFAKTATIQQILANKPLEFLDKSAKMKNAILVIITEKGG
jgi:hypothetical protein